MGVVILIIVIILIVVLKNLMSSTPSNTQTNRSNNSSSVPNTVKTNSGISLYTDEKTKKAFIAYMLVSIEDYGIVQHNHFDNKDGYYWAKDYIEKAFSAITTGSCLTYIRRGQFSIYQEALTPENKVYMDLIEALIFGDNNRNYNRANQIPDDVKYKIHLSLFTLSRLLTSNDEETRGEKDFLVAFYDTIFNQALSDDDNHSADAYQYLMRMGGEMWRLEEKCSSPVWDKIEEKLMSQAEDDIESITETIKDKGGTPEEFIRGMIYNLCSDRVESGKYHIYRGMLNEEGQEYLKITRFILKECVAEGDCPQAWADKQLSIVMSNIERAG